MNLNLACRKCLSFDESNFLRFFFAMMWMRKRCHSHRKTSEFHYHSRINRIRQKSNSIRVQYICRSIFAITIKTIFFVRTMLEANSRSFWVVYIHSTYDNISFQHWKYLERHLQRLIIWFWNENQQLMSLSCEISSLIVELSFGQKFIFDPRVDVRSSWTDQSFQFDLRIDVRRVLSSLFETSYI
jgi:hypothetical protein